MGAICCCPCEEEFEEYTHASSFSYRHCICLRHFFHRLLSGPDLQTSWLNLLFPLHSSKSVAIISVPFALLHNLFSWQLSPNPWGTPLAPTGLGHVSDDVSLSETYRLVPRSPSYDTDPRTSPVSCT
ncbi:hypothetical protein Taro_043372, partial [Colocasia esculenta]|nr:hypothetical protein [Colocasia esculenta]